MTTATTPIGPDDLRRVEDDEWVAFCRAWTRIFHEERDDAAAQAWREFLLARRCWTATDDVGHVASSGALPFTLSVPGGGSVACAGITIVTVRPDHRRRGLQRAMMTRLHDDAREAGEPVAALYASEASIYGRYGYGVAVPLHRLQVRSRDLATIRGGDARRVAAVTREDYAARARRVAGEVGQQRGGMLAMSSAGWSAHVRDGEATRPDWFAAVGQRGVVRYRTRSGDWDDRVPNGRLEVVELLAADPEAEADLWAHVAGVDLVEEVVAGGRPVDDPLRWRLAEEARVRDRSDGPLYVALLDLAEALVARHYDVRDRVVLDVADEFSPHNAGRWALDVGPDGATCTRTDDEPHVRLDVADLASLWLGGLAPATLVDAGRIEVTDPTSVGRLHRLFAVDRAPWTPFEF